MDSIPISLEVLARVLGTQPGVLSGALKADDENWKPQSDIDDYLKVQLNDKLKSVRKEGHDEGHGRGTRESLSTKEKEIRDKYELKGNTMDDLFAEVLEKAKKGSEGGTLDEESIKQSEIFQAMVTKLNGKVEARENELNQIKERVQSESLERSLRDLATTVLQSDKSKFVLPENEEIKETQVNLYLQQLKSMKWKKTDDGLVPLDDKGEVLQDDSFNNVSASDLALNLAKRQFPEAKGEQRSAPGAQTKQPGANGNGEGKKYAFPDFKNTDEIYQHISKLTDPAEINAFEEHIKTLDQEALSN